MTRKQGVWYELGLEHQQSASKCGKLFFLNKVLFELSVSKTVKTKEDRVFFLI